MKQIHIIQFFVLFCFVILVSFTPIKGKKKKPVDPKPAATALTHARHNPVKKDTVANPYYIIVDKSDYELKVYDEEGWYATYPIVFGSKDLSDKMREGDKRTPTGSFKII